MVTIQRYPRPGTSFAELIAGEQQSPGPGRHVWVLDPPSGRRAGLLIAWERQADATWWGRVVVADQEGAVEMLIRADRLRPTAS